MVSNTAAAQPSSSSNTYSNYYSLPTQIKQEPSTVVSGIRIYQPTVSLTRLHHNQTSQLASQLSSLTPVNNQVLLRTRCLLMRSIKFTVLFGTSPMKDDHLLKLLPVNENSFAYYGFCFTLTKIIGKFLHACSVKSESSHPTSIKRNNFRWRI